MTQFLVTNTTGSVIVFTSLDDYNLAIGAIDVDMFLDPQGNFNITDVAGNEELQSLLDAGGITIQDENSNNIENLDAILVPLFTGTTAGEGTNNGIVKDDGSTATGLRYLKDDGGFGTPVGAATALSTGTVTAITYGITSDGGADDVILPEATTLVAGLLGAGKWNEILANTVKISNVSTTLSTGTVTGTTYGLTSDGGADDVVLPEATTLVSGLLGAGKWNEIVANTAKSTNVSTALSIGTKTGTTLGITSDGGVDDVVLPAASITEAGLLAAADQIKINNTSGTNTGDQTSIVGISGTTAQFNTALSDGSFVTGGGTATGANTGDVAVASVGEINTGTDNVKTLSALGLAGSALQLSVDRLTAYRAITATDTFTATDGTINATSGTYTVNLPTAVGITGRIYRLKNSGAGTITLDANGAQTIDGSLTSVLAANDAVTVQSTNTNWIII